MISRKKKIYISAFLFLLTFLSSCILLSSFIFPVKADRGIIPAIFCKDKNGQVFYQAAKTDIIPYMLDSKSAFTKTSSVEHNIFNNLITAGTGLSFGDKDAESIFRRFGFAGLRFGSYGGEWRYSAIDACDPDIDEAMVSPYGEWYDGRFAPIEGYADTSVGSTFDPRVIQFSYGKPHKVLMILRDNLANGIFAITKFFVTITIILVSFSLGDANSLVGFDNITIFRLYRTFYDGIFRPLFLFALLAAVGYMIWFGIIKRQYRQALVHGLFKTLLIFFCALFMAVNIAVLRFPLKMTNGLKALLIESVTNEANIDSSLCTSSFGSGFTEGVKENDLSGKNTKALQDYTKSKMSCMFWSEFLFKPWVRAEFGAKDYTELDAGKLGNTNQKMVGPAPATYFSNGDYGNNWATFYYSVLTDKHRPADDQIRPLVSGVNGDYFRVVDALANINSKVLGDIIPEEAYKRIYKVNTTDDFRFYNSYLIQQKFSKYYYDFGTGIIEGGQTPGDDWSGHSKEMAKETNTVTKTSYTKIKESAERKQKSIPSLVATRKAMEAANIKDLYIQSIIEVATMRKLSDGYLDSGKEGVKGVKEILEEMIANGDASEGDKTSLENKVYPFLSPKVQENAKNWLSNADTSDVPNYNYPSYNYGNHMKNQNDLIINAGKKELEEHLEDFPELDIYKNRPKGFVSPENSHENGALLFLEKWGILRPAFADDSETSEKLPETLDEYLDPALQFIPYFHSSGMNDTLFENAEASDDVKRNVQNALTGRNSQWMEENADAMTSFIGEQMLGLKKDSLDMALFNLLVYQKLIEKGATEDLKNSFIRGADMINDKLTVGAYPEVEDNITETKTDVSVEHSSEGHASDAPGGKATHLGNPPSHPSDRPTQNIVKDIELTKSKYKQMARSVELLDDEKTKPTKFWNAFIGNDPGRLPTVLVSSIFSIVGQIPIIFFSLLSIIYMIAIAFILSVLPIFLLLGLFPGTGERMLRTVLEGLVNNGIKSILAIFLSVISIYVVVALTDLVLSPENETNFVKGLFFLFIIIAALIKQRGHIMEAIANISFGGGMNFGKTTTASAKKFGRWTKKKAQNASIVGAVFTRNMMHKKGFVNSWKAARAARKDLRNQGFVEGKGKRASEIRRKKEEAKDVLQCHSCGKDIHKGEHYFRNADMTVILCPYCANLSPDLDMFEETIL